MRDSDIAYEKIKKMIITCQLTPGQVIVDSELKETLKMGRTPIREALNRLCWEKQVRIIPRQCIMVSELPLHELEAIYQMRYTLSILEGELVTSRRTEEDVAKLKEIAERLVEEQVSERRVMLARELHRAISAITRNEFLQNQMNMTLDLCIRLLYLNREHMGSINETIVERYLDIIKSIEERNAENTIQLLQSHVLSFKSKFMK